jgi:hypothetical protein
MKKKLIIIGILLIVAVGIGSLIVLNPDKHISNKLSDRSRQFLAKEKKDTNSDLAYANVDQSNSTQPRSESIDVGDCFSFTVTYHITNVRSEGKCQEYLAISDPDGKIVTYQRLGNANSFDSVEGVSFRRQHPETYTETSKTINGRNYLIFTTKDGPWEASAFTYGNGYYLVFNLLLNANEDYSQDLYKMLGSIELKNKVKN